MNSRHRLVFADSRDLSWLPDNSIDLVVTSPPYPMIEMWDELFTGLNPAIAGSLEAGEGLASFEAMHAELDTVWKELYRVLKRGGMLCINAGDATRNLDGSFQLYANHVRILSACMQLGFQVLPEILWRKQTNAPNKFVGSGTLPPSAYVTLEHEWILVLRKGGRRNFKGETARRNRLESAFFWEERNIWFSDVWDFKGTRQKLAQDCGRQRSAAFPLELAYRLLNMFSVKGDLILDPFVGAGTTTLAAMCAGRSSLGVEIDQTLAPFIQASISRVVSASNRRILERLEAHRAFIEEYRRSGREPKYRSRHYGFPVVSAQEREILLNYLSSLKRISELEWKIEYCPEAGLVLNC